MKNNIINSILFILLITSCSENMDLSESVYIQDAEHEQLPAYTEWGYNTFGAYYERDVFRSNYSDVPFKIISRPDTTYFIFKGSKTSSTSSYYSYSSYNSSSMSLEVGISSLDFDTYTDMKSLKGMTFDLKQVGADITFIVNQIPVHPKVLSGTLEFKKVRMLTIDNQAQELILSGYFQLQFLIGQEPLSISEGRFDFGVTESNFYRF